MQLSPSQQQLLRHRIIAIDGPAGSGKSTTAKILAARLGFRYLDTGAMYRAITWYALQNGISPSDEQHLAELAHRLPIQFETHEDINRVFIDGHEVTREIRTPEITKHVSEVSAHKGVRVAMVAKQKELGAQGGIVAEGRDTTTVVFPQADLKVYLDASVETRGVRRLKDMERLGVASSVEDQVADLKRRDAFDSGRAHSPLTRASDAIVVDTTNLTVDEQVDAIVSALLNVLTTK